jgi:hypothetical protein
LQKPDNDRGKTMKNQSTSRILIFSALMLSLFGVAEAATAAVDSVLNDRAGAPPKVVVLGSGLSGATFRLAGTDIPASCINDVSDAKQHIGYCTEAASAVQGPGSYNLVINGLTEFSIYFEQAIVAPAPPTPPPLSDDCACVMGISDGGAGQWLQPLIPSDNLVFCLWDAPQPPPFTQQVWILGSFTYASDSYTISALWDPNNPTYDPSNPDNSTSVCALHNDTADSYEVHHPVASDQQFEACFDWMLRNGGPCL